MKRLLLLCLLLLTFFVLGCEGPEGDQGPMGPAGQQGEQGEQGPQGQQGPRGATGPQGETGPIGPSGFSGDTYLTSFDSEDAISTWFKANDGSWRVEDGVLLIAGGITGNLMRVSPAQFFYGDLDISVETEWLSGIDNHCYGVRFRGSSSGSYGFCLAKSGSYTLSEWGEDGPPVPLIGWTRSSAIEVNGRNTLRVVVSGGLIQLYINDTKVDEVSDASLTFGDVGLYVAGLQEVSFDNLRVTESGLIPLRKPTGS